MGKGNLSVKDKWVKTKWLLADRTLKRYVPKTKKFTRSSLASMTKQYRMVYFKPTNGTGGNGIARIKCKASRIFTIKKGKSTSKAANLRALNRKLKAIANGRSYLLQKGIYLKKSRGRPFDIRVMMQKAAREKWVSTAVFVKLGRPNKVATNYHQGGTLKLFRPTMRRAGYSASQIARYERRLRRIGRQTARCFSRRSARFKELGLDVALDRQGRLWILEVNTRPNFYAVKTLPDKSLYRTIVKHGKRYGRTK